MFILSETLFLHFLISHNPPMRGIGHLGDLFGALYATPHLQGQRIMAIQLQDHS